MKRTFQTLLHGEWVVLSYQLKQFHAKAIRFRTDFTTSYISSADLINICQVTSSDGQGGVSILFS